MHFLPRVGSPGVLANELTRHVPSGSHTMYSVWVCDSAESQDGPLLAR